MTDLRPHIESRLRDIQTRNNFDPNQGAEQVRALEGVLPEPETRRIREDWGVFQEMLRMSSLLDPPVHVPFDPGGLNPLQRLQAQVIKAQKIYIIRKSGTDIWKVGRSSSPYRRRKNLNTGNETDLQVWFEIEVEDVVRVERNIKRYTIHSKTRAFGKANESEWRKTSAQFVKDLVRALRGGETFEGVPPAGVDGDDHGQA